MTAEFLAQEFKKKTLKTINLKVIKQVMKEQMDMSYSKIVKVPVTANSEVNKILR